MDQFVKRGNKNLRCGYTTGSCAAAAAKRATEILFEIGPRIDDPISLVVPKGTSLRIPVHHQERKDDYALCVVKKDSGDDPDITNGVLVHAKVLKITDEKSSTNQKREASKVVLKGGLGIGVVTKPGLACAVGEAAINPVPREMIENEVKAVCSEVGYVGTLLVEVSIPQGVEIARRTFNPRLGIKGGISILGTSGIVEPMSEQALVDTIKVEMNMRRANGQKYLVITPGNYGTRFLKNYKEISDTSIVKCSNFIGESLDHAEELGFQGILLVGHLGKLVKVAAGIMNTHSKYGDPRLEVLGVHAALAGASKETLKKIMESTTSEEVVSLLDKEGIREPSLKSLADKLEFHLEERTHHSLQVGAIVFSNQYGYLCETAQAKELVALLEEEKPV